MADDAEIEQKFWKELKASPFVMLGLHGARDGHTQPMAVKFEDDHGPLWVFTTKDNTLVQAMGEAHRAIVAFSSKGHDVFASIHGELTLDTDKAELWLGGTSFGAAITRLFGADPKESYKDNVAKVTL